jgi:short-subunit dehydrogenase
MEHGEGQRPLVVVTGASQGVGCATAKALVLRHGCTVIGVARNAAALNGLQAECAAGPGTLEPLAADLASAEGRAKLLASTAGRRVHGLVNNAGLLIKREFGQWTAADAEQLFAINAIVPLLLAQALAAQLEGDPPGHVLNLSSMGGYQGSVKFPGLLAYSASKAALACISECLSEEFKGRTVRANCLCLGAVDTDMLRAAFPGYQAPVTAADMGAYVARFILEGHLLHNGKVLPVALSTP